MAERPALQIARLSRQRSSGPYSRPDPTSTGLTNYMNGTHLDWAERKKGERLTAQLARGTTGGFGLAINADNRITQVVANSPAEKAGLRAYDLVLKVDASDAGGEREQSCDCADG